MAIASTPNALSPLEWESRHFGLRVAQLSLADLADDALAAALDAARRAQTELLVWSAPGGREVPHPLLAEYGGTLVDRKLTYRRRLDAGQSLDDPPAAGVAVSPYPGTVASPPLVELALAAGIYSRFRVDERIPRERFEAMYRIWIERSVAGELARAVLVAHLQEPQIGEASEPAGMITLDESAGTASIGLVAVSAWARSRGVGSALLRAAHRWMHKHGAREARVVTQAANLPACRLYERGGYTPGDIRHVYHFWLS